MSWYFVTLIFITSCLALSWLSSKLIVSLVEIARYLRWREFIIAFFLMAFATSLPDLLVGLNAAFQDKSSLALGSILGGNLVDLTLALALGVFFTKKGIEAESAMVQKSALFTTIIAILPIFLMLDGNLNRIDGLILIASFFIYALWIFSRSDHFKKHYHQNNGTSFQLKHFLTHLGKIIVLFILLTIASQGVVASADFFSIELGISIGLVGMLIVGLGNTFSDIYLSILSARKNENWMILGEIMGSVIICATLVLGIVILVRPFEVIDLSNFITARFFLVLAALLSLLVIKTGHKITKKEGVVLLFIYIFFLITEVMIK